jgi:hypothetical protein
LKFLAGGLNGRVFLLRIFEIELRIKEGVLLNGRSPKKGFDFRWIIRFLFVGEACILTVLSGCIKGEKEERV